MNILFLCKSNVGRSQMAEVIFNKLSKKNKAVSAGFDPHKWDGQKLSTTTHVLPSLVEIGLDARENVSKRLTKEMAEQADLIIILGEKDNWPDYLKNSGNKIRYWEIEDPRHGDIDVHRNVRDKIKKKIEELIKEIG